MGAPLSSPATVDPPLLNLLSSSFAQMHTMLMERSKKLRDGPGPNSYKQNDGDILEDFVSSQHHSAPPTSIAELIAARLSPWQYMGNDTSGNLDDHGVHYPDSLNYDMQVSSLPPRLALWFRPWTP